MIKLAIAGANGRMGKAIIEYIADEDRSKNFQLSAALVNPDDKVIRKSVKGVENVFYSDISEEILSKCDALIDFSSPSNTILLAEYCAKFGIPIISGVTGFSDIQLGQLENLSKKSPIFWAPNMSIGVSIVAKAVSMIAAKLSEDFDIEILEMHHRNKVDAPSGTAIFLAENILSSLPNHKINNNMDRNGKRKQNEICFSVLRGGSVVGDHSVIFAGDSETISLCHKAQSRNIFVKGALTATKFMMDKKPGKIYNVEDIISH